MVSDDYTYERNFLQCNSSTPENDTNFARTHDVCTELYMNNLKDTRTAFSFECLRKTWEMFWSILGPVAVVPPLVLYGLDRLAVWVIQGFHERRSSYHLA
jgi:hypothetical protein